MLKRIGLLESQWDREDALTSLASVAERFDRSNAEASIAQLGNWTEFAHNKALCAFAPAVVKLEEDLQRRYFAELVRLHVTEYYGRVVAAILPSLEHASPEEWKRIERSFPQPKVDAWIPWLNKRLLKYTLYNSTFHSIAIVLAVQLRANYCTSFAAVKKSRR